MQERIDRLRDEMTRVQIMAMTADKEASAELHALVREMEQAISEMERQWTHPQRLAG